MRLAHFQKGLHDVVLIENPVDLLYLTGLSVSRGALVVTASEAVLFVDGRYVEKAKKNAPCKVELWEGDGPVRYLVEKKWKKVRFDSLFTSYDRFVGLQAQGAGIEWAPEKGLLRKERMVKDLSEISALKKAAAITWAGYKHVVSLLKVGVSEEELALEFEMFVRKKGASGLSFEPIIAFGDNSAYPHHRAGKSRLEKNQIVLIDVGAIFEGYRGDLTRVEFFGSVDPKLERMLHLTQEAQKAAISVVKAGVKLGEVDLAARQVFKREGVEKFFTHNLGHGIGLETHEAPSVKFGGIDEDLVLKEGMIFTVEPGLYMPGIGGVRWEDMICVTNSGSIGLYDQLS